MRLPFVSRAAGMALLGAASFATTWWWLRPPAPELTPLATLGPAAPDTARVETFEAPSVAAVESPPPVAAASVAEDPLQRTLVNLKAPESSVRAKALDELRRFDAAATLPVYGRVLANEPDPNIRLEALELLAQLRQDPRWRVAAENELRSRLDDGDEEVVSRIRERLESPAPGD